MPPVVAIVATLDTKGEEVAFLKQLIESEGCHTLVVDVGTLHEPRTRPDVSRDELAARTGSSMAKVRELSDRRIAVETMIAGASAVLTELHARDGLSGVVSIGGGTGTHIGTGVMRSLPLGMPKLMVSTVAARDMKELIGTKDIAVMHSVVDILGLNPVSRKVLENAAGAIAGMARHSGSIKAERPIVGLTSFGFITEGAMRVKRLLEKSGYDVAPFHANGTGGMALEDLVDQGILAGVLDLALHEFADQLYGGYCGAIGPGRLESAGKRGIPQVVVPGGLDCIVLEFNSIETMPANVRGRKVFWYDFRSGVRTSPDDVSRLAELVGDKLNRARGPVSLMVPMRGWSEADAPGGPLYEPATNEVFVSRLESLLAPRVKMVKVDAHINDEEFAQAAVVELDALMKGPIDRQGCRSLL
ncbi:MAG: Tm-1-like ATP-binding domain-containing protein [Desulfomonile sp.]|nr:Tm-1-like ATP-binding domain-containing protein [Desulfomonile sp.]